MALQGTLDTFALPDVLRLLAATKKTGRLRITGGRGTGSIWAQAGEIVGIEATHAPHASDPVDALFELLRFHDGAFTFDAEAILDDPGPATDVEIYLAQAEAQLDEWRAIEAVVPSMDAWVSLRPTLPAPEVVIDQERWTTLIAVGSGATVRRVADELCLAELPVSRAVKELVEIGLIDIADTPPPGAASVAPPPVPEPVAEPVAEPVPAPRPLRSAPLADEIPPPPPAAAPPGWSGSRPARRAKPASGPSGPEVFVPLDLPGQGGAPSYDEPDDAEEVDDDLAAAFPGLANRSGSSVDVDDAEMAKQLASLSPRAANAIRAAAGSDTDDEGEDDLEDPDGADQPLDRGLLLKFLSSVKS